MFQYAQTAFTNSHTNDEYFCHISSIIYVPGRLHPESNGSEWAGGWGVGETGVVLASYFPSHVTEVWITFKTHVTALRLCAA